LASAAEQLSTAVQEMSGSAAQIMSAIEQINRGAQQQAAASQEASAATSQIEKSAQSFRESATASLERTKRMDAMLRECRLQIVNLSQGVKRSIESTRHSLDLIAGLETARRSIDKIVDGIGIVSIQTNMLAVSGAVEAARAGEFGRGFAVVSNDIRSLARTSGDNAGRIKDTVTTIQGQIEAVQRDLERVISSAEVENQKTEGVLVSFDTVQNDLAELAAGSGQIGAAAEAILLSMKDVAQSSKQVASVAEEAASGSAQAAAAAKQQARGAEDLAAAIEEIASLAETIQRRNG
jgi:methyl-accepting chemotaxis protein